ncbi:MAG: NnrU family protein [Myxococcota bacterium]|jgi:uncharacterized membrane protein|nr:NnrU family protein [Myxococcota bacterium]
MSPTVLIVCLWLAFGASHILLSSVGLRPRLVGVLGEKGFMGVYSLVSLATFVPLVSVYFAHKHEGMLFWAPGAGPLLFWLISAGMAVAFILLVAGVLTPSPASMGAGGGESPTEARGVHLITRHSVFMALGIFGLLHLLVNGYATDIAFFSGFPIFVVIGAVHQDRRKLHPPNSPYRAFYAATPLFPFTGPRTLEGLRGLGWRAPAIGILLTAVVRYFHSAWFA